MENDMQQYNNCHVIIRSTQADVLDKEVIISGIDNIRVEYIDDTTGLLLDKAIEFLEERTLDSMINKEAHKAAAGWHARARRMK
jgi:hypothetical protein